MARFLSETSWSGGRQVADVGQGGLEVGPVLGDQDVGVLGERFEPGRGSGSILGVEAAMLLRELLDVRGGGLDGRADGLGRLADAAGRLLEGGEDLADPGAGASTVLRTSAIVWLRWLRSTGPRPTCSRIGSKNVDSTPCTTCAGDERDARTPRRDDVDPALAGEARLDRDLDVLPELLGELGRQGDPDPGRSVPSCSTRSMSATRPASIPAIRTGLPSRMPWPSRKTTSMVPPRGEEAGPAAGQRQQAEEAGDADDDDQADQHLALRGSSDHRGSFPRVSGVRSAAAGSAHEAGAPSGSARTPGRRGRRGGTSRC